MKTESIINVARFLDDHGYSVARHTGAYRWWVVEFPNGNIERVLSAELRRIAASIKK